MFTRMPVRIPSNWRLKAPLVACLAILAVGLTGIEHPQESDSDCDVILKEGQALASYRDVTKALAAGTPPGEVEGIGCFFPESEVPSDSSGAYEALVSSFFHPNVLYDYLERQARFVIKRAPRRHSGIFAWAGGYLAEAAVTAYQRTGERRFLDLFVDYFHQVLALRDDKQGRMDAYHRRVMKSWGEFRSENDWDSPPSD